MSYYSRDQEVAQFGSLAMTGLLTRIFVWMAVGLTLTAVVAYVISQQIEILQSVGPAIFLLFPIQLALVWILQRNAWSMSIATATALFLVFATLNGVLFAGIFIIYTAASIASTFAIAAGMFGTMAVFGYVTKRDLSGVGSLCFMGLIGLIIASIVNIFMHSEALYWLLSYVGVAIFLGLTAYDIQVFKQWGERPDAPDTMARAAIVGALHLYLDFINLFLYLLRLFGRRR